MLVGPGWATYPVFFRMFKSRLDRFVNFKNYAIEEKKHLILMQKQINATVFQVLPLISQFKLSLTVEYMHSMHHCAWKHACTLDHLLQNIT